MNRNDEVICTVKGYFNGKRLLTTLCLINRDSRWILVEKIPKSSSATPINEYILPSHHNCPLVPNRSDTKQEIVSIIDRSFFHKYINPIDSKTNVAEPDRKWKVEWNNFDQRILLFESKSAVEARSLDRGFRIIQNDINSSLCSSSSVSSIVTRYSNEYSLEPHYLQNPKNWENEKNNKKTPKPQNRTHCHHCGKKYFTKRRTRCWAQFSSYLCCTSEFDNF